MTQMERSIPDRSGQKNGVGSKSECVAMPISTRRLIALQPEWNSRQQPASTWLSESMFDGLNMKPCSGKDTLHREACYG